MLHSAYRYYKFLAQKVGAWRSLDSAPPWGGGGRWFESSRSDQKRGIKVRFPASYF